MNHREPTSAPAAGAGSALPCLALLLLPLFAVARAWCRPSLPVEAGMGPLKSYLAVLGTPPLRFAEMTPPPDLTTRPAAAAPPQPHSGTANAAPATVEDTTVASSASPPSASSPSRPASAPADSRVATSREDSVSTGADSSEPPKGPAPILPDETRPQVHPEDFLPFFQIPATQPGDPNVIVPVPRSASGSLPVPPSSATYTQTPR